jgi:hypothetical protein
MKAKAQAHNHALNAVCPYFTMFPLEFPMRRIRQERASGRSPVVFDLFCGRGTTLYAAREAGLECIGIDVSPVAVAIARAKLASTTLSSVMALTEKLLTNTVGVHVPDSEFWTLAYNPNTLNDIARLRQGLLAARDTGAARLLRALVLGGLHGPLAMNVHKSGYFSNQMPRTYSCKPAYAVRYWKSRKLTTPPLLDVRTVIRRRAERVFSCTPLPKVSDSRVILGDSTDRRTFSGVGHAELVITSPPYYGMKTYVADQWIRNWFLGGPPEVDYSSGDQLCSGSPVDFANSLASAWNNVAANASSELRVAVRFGGIRSRRSDPLTLLTDSFAQSRYSWKMISRRKVCPIRAGRRQADQMRVSAAAMDEFDSFWMLK